MLPSDKLTTLFASQKFAVLASASGGRPHLSLMAFAATADLKELLFVTDRDTQKYANITSNRHVAVMIDNRTNRELDTEEAMAVTATGEAVEVEGKDRERLATLYLSRHPYLQEFVTSEKSALLRVKVSAYQLVCKFQEVEKWDISAGESR